METTSAFNSSPAFEGGQKAALDDFDFGGTASGMASTEISDLFGSGSSATRTSYQDDDDDFAMEFEFDDDDLADSDEFDDFGLDDDDLSQGVVSNPNLKYIPAELLPKSAGIGTLLGVLVLFVLNLAALGGVILGVTG